VTWPAGIFGGTIKSRWEAAATKKMARAQRFSFFACPGQWK
jgi:hypothetical protein